MAATCNDELQTATTVTDFFAATVFPVCYDRAIESCNGRHGSHMPAATANVELQPATGVAGATAITSEEELQPTGEVFAACVDLDGGDRRRVRHPAAREWRREGL